MCVSGVRWESIRPPVEKIDFTPRGKATFYLSVDASQYINYIKPVLHKYRLLENAHYYLIVYEMQSA